MISEKLCAGFEGFSFVFAILDFQTTTDGDAGFDQGQAHSRGARVYVATVLLDQYLLIVPEFLVKCFTRQVAGTELIAE